MVIVPCSRRYSKNHVCFMFSIMHDGRFLHVPIVTTDADTEEETVIGILDVLDCAVHTLSRFTHADKNPVVGTDSEDHDYIYNTKVNSEADRAMFTSLFLREDMSEMSSSEKATSAVKNGIHNEININDSVSQSGFKSVAQHTALTKVGNSDLLQLKIKGLTGDIYRAEVELDGLNFSKLESKIYSVVGKLENAKFFYLDEDGDEILLSSEACLESALKLVTRSSSLKFTIVIKNPKQSFQASHNNVLVVLGISTLVGVLGIGIYVIFKQSTRTDTYSRSNYHAYNRYR